MPAFQYVAIGRQDLTVGVGVLQLTVPALTHWCLIRVEVANVRYTEDGSTPTTTHGTELLVGEALHYTCDPRLLQFAQEAVNAVITVCYYAKGDSE